MTPRKTPVLADRLMGELAAFRVPLYTDELAKMLDVSKVTVESTLLALVGDGRVRVVSWAVAREMAASA